MSQTVSISPTPLVDIHHKPSSTTVIRLTAEQPSRWESAIGEALRIFTQHAGYSLDAQDLSLRFFRKAIIPYLGQAPKDNISPTPWTSFVNDDGFPLEISWDWCGEQGAPCVRFAMEPVGMEAGTPSDPQNRFAGARCVQHLRETCPGFNDVWFNHMALQMLTFNDLPHLSPVDGHGSRLFLGFDLSARGILSKAYFTSKVAAAVLGRSDIEVTRDAIASLPSLCPRSYMAFEKFAHFFNKPRQTDNLILEGLALDCIAPTDSRIKLYVRGMKVSLEAVKGVVTLGGDLCAPILQRGLEQLQHLWQLLFGEKNEEPSLHPSSDIRTAGILYNYELRPGLPFPVPKVYIPVRHYCSSDEHVLQALQTFLCQYRGDDGKLHGYLSAMRSIFSPGPMANSTGVHRLVSCSFTEDGLKLAVYINPQFDKLSYL